MRDASFYGLFFGGYELSCYMFRTYVPSMPDELNYFISGGLAGMMGWTLAMPFDVPKTNIQARYDTKVVGSYFPELFKIARERGIVGLYGGLGKSKIGNNFCVDDRFIQLLIFILFRSGPTLIRAFPANAALFLGVELSKRMFDNWVWPDRKSH